MLGYLKYVVKRLLNYAVMLFIAVSLTYLLAASMLNARSNYESKMPRPPQESIEQALDKSNLNDRTPLPERYLRWISGVLSGDWGLSPTGRPVQTEFAPRVWASVRLLLLSTVLSVVIGVSLGVYTAQRQYHWQDRLLSGLASLLIVVPTVVFAILVAFFAIEFNDLSDGLFGMRVFYVTGLSSYSGPDPIAAFIDFLQHIALPTFSLTTLSAVGYHIGQRTYLLDEMHADYVRTARAKGLTKKLAVRRHALRVSLIPTAVGVAFSIAGIFTGAVMTEKIFGIHGLGEYFITAINTNDVNGTVAVAAFSAACTLLGALLADLFAAALDPRIKLS